MPVAFLAPGLALGRVRRDQCPHIPRLSHKTAAHVETLVHAVRACEMRHDGILQTIRGVVLHLGRVQYNQTRLAGWSHVARPNVSTISENQNNADASIAVAIWLQRGQ